MDSFARSMMDLLNLMKDLETRGIEFRSLTEGLETQTPSGRLILHVPGALAQSERELISERSEAGVKSAEKRGVRFGRKSKLSIDDVKEIWYFINEKNMTRVDVAA